MATEINDYFFTGSEPYLDSAARVPVREQRNALVLYFLPPTFLPAFISLPGLWAFTSSYAWVGAGMPLFIEVTTNKGATWKDFNVPKRESRLPCSKMSFADTLNGWAIMAEDKLA